MATLSHPAPLAPRNPIFPKLRRPRRRSAAAMTAPPAAEQTPGLSVYTGSALPLALTWFLLPTLLLLLSQHLGWTR